MTPVPAAGWTASAATYDAWNRLVKLQETVGEATQTVAEYQYDSRAFRIAESRYEEGVPSQTRHVYFSPGWRVLEDCIDSETATDQQFIWGLRYIDDLVLVKKA